MSTNTDANTNTAQETAPNPETISKSEHDAAPITEPQKIKPESQSEVLTAEELADFRKYQDSKKSDADNIAKACLDALNGIAFYDDSQVCELSVSKYYGEIPKVEIIIDEVN